MKVLIERLVASGHAYVADDHVLFDVPSMPDYGRLARALARRDDRRRPRRSRALQARPHGLRAVEALEARRAVLGRRRAALQRRAGPAGTSSARRCRGSTSARPSTSTAAASTSCSPTTRTRSRSRAAPSTRRVMANYWMHNGFLQVEGEKMSKSLGNFVTMRELLADWPGEVLRFNMLRTHYRQPIDWTMKSLEESAKTLDDWYALAGDVSGGSVGGAVLDALCDDLNTPHAITELARPAPPRPSAGSPGGRASLRRSLRFLGFLVDSAAAWKRAQARGARRRRPRRRGADRGPHRRAQDEELRRIRPHPRRASRHGRGSEGLQGRHHLGARAMTTADASEARVAAVSAGGCAAARGDIPRQRRGADRRRLRSGAAGRLGGGRPMTRRRSQSGSAVR